MHSVPFDNLEESKSTIPFYGVSIWNSTHKSIGSWYTMTKDLNTLTQPNDNYWPKSLLTFIPCWVAKTIEVAGLNAGDSSIGW